MLSVRNLIVGLVNGLGDHLRYMHVETTLHTYTAVLVWDRIQNEIDQFAWDDAVTWAYLR